MKLVAICLITILLSLRISSELTQEFLKWMRVDMELISKQLVATCKLNFDLSIVYGVYVREEQKNLDVGLWKEKTIKIG